MRYMFGYLSRHMDESGATPDSAFASGLPIDGGPASLPQAAEQQPSQQPQPDAVERVRLGLDPRLPPMQPGRNGGTLYRGGLPAELRAPDSSERMRRKVRDGQRFAAKMRKLADSPHVTRALRSILCDPDHDQFARVLEYVTERGYGRVPQKVEAEHTHRHAVVLLPPMDAPPSPALSAISVAASSQAMLPTATDSGSRATTTPEPQHAPGATFTVCPECGTAYPDTDEGTEPCPRCQPAAQVAQTAEHAVAQVREPATGTTVDAGSPDLPSGQEGPAPGAGHA